MTYVQSIVGIAGASGAGKSHLANQLLQRLRDQYSIRDVAILHEDSYYRAQDELSMNARQSTNYDHPDAFEHSLLVKQLELLKQGTSIEVPEYDYTQHNRSDKTTLLEPPRILILEGILIFHHEHLRQLLDLKIYVDVPMDICLSRRLERDIVSRGRTLDSVLTQYHRSVRPMFFEFIEPSKSYADLIVPRGGQNETAIGVLHGHLERLIQSRGD
ncbi:MAG: uridine kinase [Planctomycetota bacterium]